MLRTVKAVWLRPLMRSPIPLQAQTAHCRARRILLCFFGFGLSAKDKLAYFKDNIATDEDDFDASQYYYNRHGGIYTQVARAFAGCIFMHLGLGYTLFPHLRGRALGEERGHAAEG